MRPSLRTHAMLLSAVCTATVLDGCAGMQAGPRCPDIAGTYANQAEGSPMRLTSLLLPSGSTGHNARTVTLSLEGEPQRLVVVAGSQRSVLEPDSEFFCEARTLRLAEPMERRINLGSFLTQDVEIVHALSKDAAGALQATTSTREHSVIWGKSVTGPLRPGGVLHWKAVAAPQDR